LDLAKHERAVHLFEAMTAVKGGAVTILEPEQDKHALLSVEAPLLALLFIQLMTKIAKFWI